MATDKQRGLIDRMASALTSISVRAEDNDSADMIDWCTTMQILTAELVATAMTDITNRPTYEDCANETV